MPGDTSLKTGSPEELWKQPLIPDEEAGGNCEAVLELIELKEPEYLQLNFWNLKTVMCIRIS